MAHTEALPIPPELAVPDEPIPADVLDRWADAVARAFPDATAGELPGLVADAGSTVAVFDALDTEEADRFNRWQITDTGGAEWAMRHVAVTEAEIAALRLQAEEWTRRIGVWFDTATRPLEARHAFFAGHLERYALARRAEDPKAKTLTLPSGQVRTRTTSAAAIVQDEAELVAWVKDNLPDVADTVVKTVESVRLTELRRHLVVVEVPVSVVLAPCGCVVTPVHPDGDEATAGTLVRFDTPDELAAWTVGTAAWCPDCGEDRLVARWRDTDYVVRSADGRPVPGTDVTYPTVRATVNAEAP